MAGWRVAASLNQLLEEINASAPGRSKASDGSIGDRAHQSTGSGSDHNPHCCGSVVTARDFTHDPDGGFDAHVYADWQRRRCKGEILVDGQRETRVKYIISNGRIASPSSNWAWSGYYGFNRHDKHVHISVDCTRQGGAMDSTKSWGWAGGDDVSAQEVWAWDVDPSGGKHSASGATWTTFERTGYLANDWAPQTSTALKSMAININDIEQALMNTRAKVGTLQTSMTEVKASVGTQNEKLNRVKADMAEVISSITGQEKAITEMRWLLILLLILAVAGGVGALTWAGLS